MNGVIDLIKQNKKYKEIEEQINVDKNKISLTNITDSQKAQFICSFSNKDANVVVCSNLLNAKKMLQDIKFFTDREVLFFPAKKYTYFNLEAESVEIKNQRMYVINKILEGTKCIVVTTIEALAQGMLPKEIYSNIEINIEEADEINVNELVEKFTKIGYTRAEVVEGPGQFAIRGYIIDVFPVSAENPYRIELYGDDVDSIRTFDIISQRTVETVENVRIIPTSEGLISSETISEIKEIIKNEIDKLKTIEEKEILQKDLEEIENGELKNCLDRYFKYICKEKYISFLSYFSSVNVFLDEPERIYNKLAASITEYKETIKILVESNQLPLSKYIAMLESEEIIKESLENYTTIYLENINTQVIFNEKRKVFTLDGRENNFFRKSLSMHIQDIESLRKKDYATVIVIPVKKTAVSIYNQLLDNKVRLRYIEDLSCPIQKGEVYITHGMLSSGFISDEFKISVIAEKVYGVVNKQRKNKTFDDAKSLTFQDLKEGDYIVHINHGIGKYLGIETIISGGFKKDYIKILYDKNGTLYVPVSSLDCIRKYFCDEDKAPKLNTLGGKDWDKTKQKVKGAVEDIAKELIKLYARRQEIKGFKFSQDTPWQSEFEDTFPYEITDDQRRCIDEVKSDMEKDKPMDRLLCGDVGFGKTEVAIRAAFKAVMDSKQVAYLVPTTVLAMQQYKNFNERMKNFGINVELISRLKTKKEQTEILERLKEGKVDILVGTHRLFSKDVEYKDLGLLIIDEEQRFGVKHKETIKKYKENIDVLSMTATPIPRTLHMSIIGIRDMSVIYEPPQERLPVHTYVIEYNENIIKNAIENELERDGQVFYIYNRVEDIEDVADKIAELVKDAKVGFAHGKMTPKQVEEIMQDFVDKKINVLVCTTILESGIDIPNANTIIVENADRLGLAQLYQIRGRVGRSTRLAYAYITHPKNKMLTEESEKRLKAIKDFTEFGSGYKIALRDLEIRGAGNVLGPQQHGHLMAVGYDLYCKMLEIAIEKEKKALEGVEVNDSYDTFAKESEEVKIDLDVNAFIPSKYIKSDILKIEMYQKIADIKTKEDSLEVVDELIDRYGDIPKEVENLIKIVEIRNLAKKLNVTSIRKVDNLIKINNKDKFYLTSQAKNDILLFVETILKNMVKEN